MGYSNQQIKVMRALRAELNMMLDEARRIAEIVSPIFVENTEESRRIATLTDERDAARADLVALVRLTDYFVSHPAEYAAWKAERRV